MIKNRWPTPAKRKSSSRDSNSCYYVFNYSIQLWNLRFNIYCVGSDKLYVTNELRLRT